MVNKISQLDINGAFRRTTTHRGHNKQLSILYCRTEKGNCWKLKLFWSNRLHVVRNWNVLAYDTVNSSSVYQFNKFLQGVHFNDRGLSIVVIKPSSPFQILYVLCTGNKHINKLMTPFMLWHLNNRVLTRCQKTPRSRDQLCRIDYPPNIKRVKNKCTTTVRIRSIMYKVQLKNCGVLCHNFRPHLITQPTFRDALI